MKILVLGSGSIGQRHISNLTKLIPKKSIEVFDIQPKRAEIIAKKYGVSLITDYKFSNYNCVFVCTPPINHIDIAIKALKEGTNVFIEKPLSSNQIGIKQLKKLKDRKNKLVFVGYNFRFNKGINLIKRMIQTKKLGKPIHASAYFGQYLPDWRPLIDYTKNYTAIKKLGGGIVFDGSHEVDYLSWILGQPKYLQSEYVNTSILKSNVEGIAEIILKFSKNILANIHLDFVRREYRRSLEILCEKGIIQWSLEHKIKLFNANKGRWTMIKINENTNDMYLAEIKHVIDCIKHRKQSKIINLENGISTFEISKAIINSGKKGKRIYL